MKAYINKKLLLATGILIVLFISFFLSTEQNNSVNEIVKNEQKSIDIKEKYSYSFNVFQW